MQFQEQKPRIHWNFDFDGTLFDTGEALVEAYTMAVSNIGGLMTPMAKSMILQGENFRRFLAVCDWNGAEPDFNSIRESKNEIYASCLDLVKPNDSVLSLALSLMPNVSIVTSAQRQSVQLVLSHFKLSKDFKSVISADDVRSVKPSPELYLLSKIRNSADMHIAIEDSDSGALSARLAGCLVLRLN